MIDAPALDFEGSLILNSWRRSLLSLSLIPLDDSYKLNEWKALGKGCSTAGNLLLAVFDTADLRLRYGQAVLADYVAAYGDDERLALCIVVPKFTLRTNDDLLKLLVGIERLLFLFDGLQVRRRAPCKTGQPCTNP